MKYFWYLLYSFFYSSTIILIGILNPIHSLLLLINVFLLGSLFLFSLNVEFFGLVFFMVYIGAIVVLFLFIVMMLDIKISNTLQHLSTFFSFKNLIIGLILIEFLIYISENVQLVEYVVQLKEVMFEKKLFTYYTELYDYFQILKTTTHIEAVGQVLYRQHLFAFLICSILLFIAMVGAIVMTIENKNIRNIKQQHAGLQSVKVFRTTRKIINN